MHRITAYLPEAPKLWLTLREGYGLRQFRRDSLAGLTVAVVALPLAMALAIASGTTPDKGLFTAVIAGFLISFLGGSRIQVGGPTGAFVVVVYATIAKHGYDGLLLATLMAGVFLLLFSLARLGTVIKFIPYPVITGFTAGIAVIIFSSQIKDLFGLQLDKVPGEFLQQWQTYLDAADSWQPLNLALALGCLATILLVRRYRPHWPAFLIAVALGSLATAVFALPVDTIGSRFGGIPRVLPLPELPPLSMAKAIAVLPDAFTIALLAGIESLLSAVIADGMTGGRHRSNTELMAQGVANIASACFGGLPATGAIARTVTNIKSGGRTPVAGMMHALFLLLFMLALAPLAAYVPLASLAAVLVMVAWNMSEIERFKHLMRAPVSDRMVLLVTFGLTVLVDLTLAIQVGVVLAALLFMKRMSEVTEIGSHAATLDVAENGADTPEVLVDRSRIPPGVEIFQINGPFFFGVANRLGHVLDQLERPPRVFILRLRNVPMIDATGVGAMEDFIEKCRRRGTEVILTAVNPQPRTILKQMGLLDAGQPAVHLAPDLTHALERARAIVEDGASAGTPD